MRRSNHSKFPPHQRTRPSASQARRAVSRDGNRRLYTELNEPAAENSLMPRIHEIQEFRPIRVRADVIAVISPREKIVFSFFVNPIERWTSAKIQIDLYDVEPAD